MGWFVKNGGGVRVQIQFFFFGLCFNIRVNFTNILIPSIPTLIFWEYELVHNIWMHTINVYYGSIFTAYSHVNTENATLSTCFIFSFMYATNWPL